MTMVESAVTFQKDLAPGVTVRIEGVPAKVRREGAKPGERLFDRTTAAKIEELLAIARRRMESGETDIRLDFRVARQDENLRIEFLSAASVENSLMTYRQALDRVTCAFAFDKWSAPSHARVDEQQRGSFMIQLSFDEATIDKPDRLVALRHAIMHFGSADTPLMTDERTLSIVYCLVPHRGALYDRVRLSLSADQNVILTDRSRELVLRSWLERRRSVSPQAEFTRIIGTLLGATVNNMLVFRATDSTRSSKVKHQPALGAIIRDFLGASVVLTCISDVHRGRRRVEVIEMEPAPQA